MLAILLACLLSHTLRTAPSVRVCKALRPARPMVLWQQDQAVCDDVVGVACGEDDVDRLVKLEPERGQLMPARRTVMVQLSLGIMSLRREPDDTKSMDVFHEWHEHCDM